MQLFTLIDHDFPCSASCEYCFAFQVAISSTLSSVGNDWLLSVMSGEPHKERRVLAQRYFAAQLKDWQLVQMESARTLIRNLSSNLSDWEALIRL